MQDEFKTTKKRISSAQRRKIKVAQNKKIQLHEPQIIQLTRGAEKLPESKKSYATITKDVPAVKEFKKIEPEKQIQVCDTADKYKLQYSWNLYGTLFNDSQELMVLGFMKYNTGLIDNIADFWCYATNSFLNTRLNQETSCELSFTRVNPDALELIKTYPDAYEINIIGPSYYEGNESSISTREKLILELVGGSVSQDEKQNDEIIKSFLGFKFRRGSKTNFRLWFTDVIHAKKYESIINSANINKIKKDRPPETMDNYSFVRTAGRRLAEI